ncbi:MAG: hypothetical protein VYE64_05285 [Planctomycetota bacterium]|nr:hypothetical protein [Planctomycetota bacterium]
MNWNFLWVPVVTGCFFLAGCDSSDMPAPGTAPAEVTQEPDANDKADADDASILARAAKIIDQAKESGSSQAEVASEWLSARMQDVSESTSQAADSTGEWATETFQYLKEQGMTTAGSTHEWLAEDIQNMGAWHYKVVVLDLNQPTAETEQALNDLGKERWECFHVLASSDGQTTMFFKKGRRSYLKSIPFKDVMRLLPLLGSGDEGDVGGDGQ